MNNRLLVRACVLSVCGFSPPAIAQSNIDGTNKFSWGENVGWMNWRDAGDTEQGVRVRATFLSGFIWCENAGWLNVGDGSPVTGTHYANVSGGDFGVNIDPGSGDLFGLAWGENIGWVNFDTRASLRPFGDQARLDRPNSRIRGFAWGENIGWVNLDDAAHFVGFRAECYANCDGSTVPPILNVDDFTCFINEFAAAQVLPHEQQINEYANCDGSTNAPVLNVDDFTCFINAFAAGCS